LKRSLMTISIASGAALSALLSACGSSDSPSGASSSTVKLMMITATGAGLPGHNAVPGAKAAVSAVNAAGGIDGSRIDLQICDTHGNPNQALACAQKAVADKSIISTVGNNDYTGGAPITSALNGKLAAVGHKPYTAPDFASKIGFATDCGGIGIAAGETEWLATQGSKTIVALVFDNPGGQAVVKFLEGELKKLFPSSKLFPVPIPQTASDMTSYAAQAISKNPDGVMLALPEPLTVAGIKQLRAQDYQGKIQVPATVMTPSAIRQIGDATANLQASGCYSYNSPGHKKYLGDMKKYQAAADTGDEGLNAWLGVKSFAKVMKGKDLTRKGVLDTFNTTSSLTTDGLTPPIDFTKETGVPGFARLFVPTVANHEIKDGKLVDITPTAFLNILTGKVTTGG
jgi:ABC-type branched-subunit amino acid transport system substrate-binding protein